MNFNINRFFSQLKWDVLIHYRFLFIGYLIVFGLMMLGSLLGAYDFDNHHGGLFWYTMYLMGLIFTSSIFNELNGTSPATSYLMIPSSHLEKFFSKLAISTVIFAVATIVIFTTLSAVSTVVLAGRVGEFRPFFNPFFEENIDTIVSYFGVQAFFFLGAVAFQRSEFFKTIGIWLFITLFFGFLAFAFFSTALFSGIETPTDGTTKFSYSFPGMINGFDGLSDSFGQYSVVLTWLYWLVLIPALWAASYFKLTEKEV